MSFFRITNPAGAAVPIPDLGVDIAASATVVLSNQFSVNELYLSADLEALVIAGTLEVEIDFGTGFSPVLAGDYTNRDCIAAFLNVYEVTNNNNNEKLVDNSEASGLHHHDSRYFTETELTGTGGAALVGLDNSGLGVIGSVTNVQEALEAIDDLFQVGITLDAAYDNDTDGILLVDGSAKDLNFRSDNANDILISRIAGADIQDALHLDVSGDELILGALAQGALASIDVRIRTNLIIEGDLQVTGTTTDTTVDELNIGNANIRLRDGATGVAATDAYIEVERGTSGVDTRLQWNETTDRWQAGLLGDLATLALLEKNEIVTGIWEMQGSATTAPNLYLTNKAAAPTTNLGSASQIPLEMINNILCVYDKTRLKHLSVAREAMVFVGRDNANNANEYARIATFTSNQAGNRLLKNSTLVGISIQTNGSETWTARVRKNGVATNVASLAAAGVAGAQDSTLNVDFAAGDQVQVYIDGTSVDRPVIKLHFAERY